MRIAELAKKYEQYGLDRRTIDYYSSDKVNLIPYRREEGSNYRIYGEEAETVIKKIIILRDVGLSSKKIKEALDNPSYFTTAIWNEHIEKLQNNLEKLQKHYSDMIKYAEDMRDSGSRILPIIKLFDDPSAFRATTSYLAKLQKYIENPDSLAELSESLPADLSDFSNSCYTFLKSIIIKKNHGLEYDSHEVQLSVTRFIEQSKRFFGSAVYLLYQIVNSIDISLFNFSDEDAEMYQLFMRVLGICAEWFRLAKTQAAALDFNEFEKEYKEQIQKIDLEVGESTFDEMTMIIDYIANIPSRISIDNILKLEDVFNSTISFEIQSQGFSDETSEQAINLLRFIYNAFKQYVTVHHLSNC